MAKLNKKEADKKYFDKYKNTGRRESNKLLRQERAKKRQEKLQNRKNRTADPNTEERKVIKYGDIAFFDTLVQENTNTRKTDYLSPSKRARKIYRRERILNENLPKDGRDYGWWKSLFQRVDNEVKAEENAKKSVFRTLKSNKGKVTIAERREENQNG